VRPTSAGRSADTALPQFATGRFRFALRRQPLLDRVLMRARERGEHELAGVRMARVYRKVGAVLGSADDFAHVREIEVRPDALRVQVHSERDEADVARAFAVAEQAAFDAIRARHQRQFGGGDAGAAIVVRMQREHDAVAAREIRVHPLDLVGVDVRRRHFHRCRQVEDHRPRGRGLPDVHHRLADLPSRNRARSS
jgi:hypothetical protein